jgi:uncharacterized OsmC-like protein
VDPGGLSVSANWEMASDRPTRVGQITINIVPPTQLPDERLAALLAVAQHCTVHNSLAQPPEVSIGIADRADGAAA